jgi:type II secretory pathway component PulF
LTRSLYYPAVMLHLAVLVFALTQFGQGMTAVVVTLITSLAFAYTAAFALYMLIRVSWRSEVAQRFWLFLPIIGNSLATAYAYRWITALRLEFSAGVPIPDAVSDAWLASGYAGSHELALEGERELRAGRELSGLINHWRQLPRDWVDFVETGEISGALETAFTNLEAEAARSWTLAQQRMTEWLPKIFSFILLVIVATMVARMAYNQTVAPMEEVEKAINGQ